MPGLLIPCLTDAGDAPSNEGRRRRPKSRDNARLAGAEWGFGAPASARVRFGAKSCLRTNVERRHRRGIPDAQPAAGDGRSIPRLAVDRTESDQLVVSVRRRPDQRHVTPLGQYHEMPGGQ